MAKQNPELEKFAEFLEKGTIALFAERGELTFSTPPEKERRRITEYEGRMRADGMEKFDNNPTYVSAVNFYANESELKKKKALGALIVYVQQDYIARLMKLLQYPPIDDENEQAMLDSCGTLCNIIGGKFKSEISGAGYIELAWSHFITYRNSAVRGVEFCSTEYEMYLLSFKLEGQKRVVMEMTMGIVPGSSGMIDVEQNSAILKINKEIYLRILSKATGQTQQDIRDLEMALPANDFVKVQAIAHRWKGDYDNMRITALSALARQLNDLAKTTQDKEKLTQTFGEFKNYFQQLQQFLDSPRAS